MSNPVIELAMKTAGQFEGCSLKEYICPAGKPTIGHGRVIKSGQFPKGITQAQADAMFAEDMQRFYDGVIRMVKVECNVNELAALTSFAYNCGLAALKGSTLLKKLNSGDKAGAAAEFTRWTRGGGKVLPGLVRRREFERLLFLRKPS